MICPVKKREQKLCCFLRLTNTVGWYFASQRLHFLLGEISVHICVNDAAGNGVDLDAAGSQFPGQRPGEGVYAAFGGGVSYFHGGASVSPDGGDVNDFSGMVF